MAEMWPAILPDWVLADPRRSSEVSVFRKLEKQLDNTWVIFYSRPWWGLTARGGEKDGEADFIVVHPAHGLLFLEVKGGRISYDPVAEQWQSKDRNGITNNIKDPVGQAKTCKHQFLKSLQKIPRWPKDFIRFRHGVVFPDSDVPPASDPRLGQYDKILFCHIGDFEGDFAGWIHRRLMSHDPDAPRQECGPGLKGLDVVRELVAKPVLLRVPMLRDVETEMVRMDGLLTGAQLTLLSIIEQEARVVVEGGAGTGKTVLAIELAARSCDAGKSVLYCCRSGPLAVRTAERLKQFSRVTVLKFEDLANSAKWSPNRKAVIPDGGPWDVVLVDEGQDFDWEWWELIDQIMPVETGLLRVFADSNQAVYRLKDDLETRLNAKALPLRINLRNTKAIARVTELLYEGPLIQAPGPDGVPPAYGTQQPQAAMQHMLDVLVELINGEKIQPSMIAILVPDANVREDVIGVLAKRRIPAANAARTVSGSVVVETIARFKGLESAVVLLLANNQVARNQELSYVGVSRARSRLWVFGALPGSVLEKALSSAKITPDPMVSNAVFR